MSESDVSTILRRLDVIDERIRAIGKDNETADEIHEKHGQKIERLQLALAFVAGIAASAGGTSILSLVVG